nr:MAG TPA: hypothetical protein [Caudoviricetes sp.]
MSVSQKFDNHACCFFITFKKDLCIFHKNNHMLYPNMPMMSCIGDRV